MPCGQVNKRSIALDMKDARAREIAGAIWMCRQKDSVFVEQIPRFVEKSYAPQVRMADFCRLQK
jgi:hypothetical protein